MLRQLPHSYMVLGTQRVKGTPYPVRGTVYPLPAPGLIVPMPHHPLHIAHRGMPRLARENTLPSFALALEAGADGLELDVHATRDGVVVVHHDAVLSGGLAIADETLATIR